MNVINKLIRKLGKSDYKIDERLSRWDIFLILSNKGMSAIRGGFLKLRLKKSSGIIFTGVNCNIRFSHKIRVGHTLSLGDNVEINALSIRGVEIGNNVSILKNSIIECTGVIRELGEGLKIGNNVGIGQNAFIQVRGFVSIGNNVMFGPNVSIFSENHVHDSLDIAMIAQGTIRKGVTIEDDVWLGSGVKILDGVTVGIGSIVAAGSVVNKNVEPYSIVGGVPAKVIKFRKTE